MASHTLMPPTVYGREREQAQLRQLLDATIAGHGRLVLISGEAGIGKTTLVNDLINFARKQDALVLAGGCYDLTITPPYGPWTEAIRAYQPDGNLPPFPAWFSDPDELERVGGQTALFEEARRFFLAIAAHQPLVIVLEDLHWADPASIDALRYLARALRDDSVLLLVTYRGMTNSHAGTSSISSYRYWFARARRSGSLSTGLSTRRSGS